MFTCEFKIYLMILEVAILNVIPEKTVEFEAAFEIAQEIISSIRDTWGINCNNVWKFPINILYW